LLDGFQCPRDISTSQDIAVGMNLFTISVPRLARRTPVRPT
jgi:hypothetical protein